jgi:hypothetical protein
MENEFPSNRKHGSEEKDAPKDEEKKVAKVVQAEAIQRKRSLWGRFKQNFISGPDSKTVVEHVFFEILIPAGKDLFLDALNAGFERKFYGEVRSRGRRGYSHQGYTAYNRIGSALIDPRNRRDEEPRRSRSRGSSRDFGEVVLQSRAEATEVLDNMYELLDRYRQVTVADLLDLCDLPRQYTDNNYGWVDLRGADVQRVSEGYLLILPRAESLE